MVVRWTQQAQSVVPCLFGIQFEKLWKLRLSSENLFEFTSECGTENWLHTHPYRLSACSGREAPLLPKMRDLYPLLPSIIHVLEPSLSCSLPLSTHVYNKTPPPPRMIECLHITPSLFMQINLGRNWPVISLGVFCGNLAAKRNIC